MSSRSSNKAPSIAPAGDGTNLSDQIANLIKNKSKDNNNSNEETSGATASSSPSTTELPPDWLEKKDPKSGKVYYFNKKTKQTSWKRPKAPSTPTTTTSTTPTPAAAAAASNENEGLDQQQQQQQNASSSDKPQDTSLSGSRSQSPQQSPRGTTKTEDATEEENNTNNKTSSQQQQEETSPKQNNNNSNISSDESLNRKDYVISSSCPVQLSNIEVSSGSNVTNSSHFNLFCNATLEKKKTNTNQARIVFDFASSSSAFAYVDLSNAKSSLRQDPQNQNQSVLMLGLEVVSNDNEEQQASSSSQQKQQQNENEETKTTEELALEEKENAENIDSEKNNTQQDENNNDNNEKKSMTMITIRLPRGASPATQEFLDDVGGSTLGSGASSESSNNNNTKILHFSNGSTVSNLFAFAGANTTDAAVAAELESFFTSTQSTAKSSRESNMQSYVSSILGELASGFVESSFDQFLRSATDLFATSSLSLMSQLNQQVKDAKQQIEDERAAVAKQEQERQESNPLDRFVASLTNSYVTEFQKFSKQTEEMQSTFSNEAKRLTNLVSQKAHQDELLSTSAPSRDSAVEEHIRHRRTLEEAFKSLQTMHHETCDELDATRKKMFELRSELSETQKESRKSLEKERERSQAALRNVQQDASDHMKHLAANVDVMREKHTEEMDSLRESHEEAMSIITKKLHVAELKMLRAVEETEKAKFQITQQNLEDRQKLAEIERSNAALELQVKELKKTLEDKTNEVSEYEDHVQRAVDRRAAAELTRFKRIMIERTLGSPSSQSQTAATTGRMTPRSTTMGGTNNSMMMTNFSFNNTNNNASVNNMNNNGDSAATPDGNALYNSFAKGGSTPRGTHLVKAMKDTSDAIAMMSPRSDNGTPLVVAANNNNDTNNNNNNNSSIPRLNIGNFNNFSSSSPATTTRTPREPSFMMNSARRLSPNPAGTSNSLSFLGEDHSGSNNATTESETYRRLMEISGHLKDRLTSLGGVDSRVGGGIGRGGSSSVPRQY